MIAGFLDWDLEARKLLRRGQPRHLDMRHEERSFRADDR